MSGIPKMFVSNSCKYALNKYVVAYHNIIITVVRMQENHKIIQFDFSQDVKHSRIIQSFSSYNTDNCESVRSIKMGRHIRKNKK